MTTAGQEINDFVEINVVKRITAANGDLDGFLGEA
jgi:hypothetical protein